MVKVIALIGPPQGGKSTLAFSFSKFLEKKGLKASVASMGENAKALKYTPFWDARKNKTDVFKVAKGEKLDFAILDYTATVDSFFFSKENALEKCDVILLVFEAGSASHQDAEELARVFSERIGKKVIPVENKSELVKSKLSFPSKVISVSGWEGMGFEKLHSAIKN